MRKRLTRRIGAVLTAAVVAALSFALAGCDEGAQAGSGGAAGEHEPLTMYAYNFLNYDNFLAGLKEAYPEVQIQLVPKHCNNHTQYMKDSAAHGDAADIVSTTQVWDAELQEQCMLDLSGYSFTSRFNPSRLAMTTNADGSLYLLPSCYSIFSPAYNKTILEEHGWDVPTSFEEMKALVPEIEAAGLKPFSANATLAGFSFQYLCDLGDTLNWQTREGMRWQRDFVNGDAPARGFVDDAVSYLGEWADLGAFPESDLLEVSDTRIREDFNNGESVFLIIGSSLDRYTQNEDGSGYEFGLLPWLSPDGSNNYLISQSLVYHGINKRLAEPGSEQKLEDALKVLDFMSTLEGMQLLANDNPNMIYPHKDYTIDESSLYYDVKDLIAQGQTAELIYAGWDDVAVDVGDKIKDFMLGACTEDELIDAIDDAKRAALESGGASSTYGYVEETLSEDLVAQLVGRAYCDGTGADCFLLPQRLYYPGTPQINEGVNILYDGPLTESDISYVLPSSYYGRLLTIEMTGAELAELQQRGFNKHNTGKICPYSIIAKEGFEVEPDETYKVVATRFDEGTTEQFAGRIVDTGVVGMDTMKELCVKLEAINAQNAAWK